MGVDFEIINKISEYLFDCHLEYPKIVTINDLIGFQQQNCEMPEFDCEWIDQSPGGGITGDSFSGKMAFELGDGKFLLVEYCC
jgi:hypothetical protein